MTRATSTATTGRGGWSGILLLCAAAVLWGTIGPAVDVVDGRSDLSVLTIGAYRSVVAVAVLAVVTTVGSRWAACRAVARALGRRVVVTGLLTAAFQLLFFVAVVIGGVSVTTVVALGFAPVLLLFVSCVRHRRPPTRGETLTVGTALVGLFLVGTTGSGAEVSHPVLGVLAALASGAAYACSAALGGHLTQEHDALAVTTCTTAVVAAVLVPGGLVLAVLRGEALGTTDPVAWLLVVYLGAVTMAFAYVLLYAGLRSTPSGTAVVATLLEPVTAVLIAVLLLGERLTPAGALGCLLILVAIAGLGRRTPPQPQ